MFKVFVLKHKFSGFMISIACEVESNPFDRRRKENDVYNFLSVLVFSSSVGFNSASFVDERCQYPILIIK